MRYKRIVIVTVIMENGETKSYTVENMNIFSAVYFAKNTAQSDFGNMPIKEVYWSTVEVPVDSMPL